MLRYLFAFAFFMHGLAHLSGVVEAWTPVQNFAAAPWLFTKSVTMNTAVGRLFGLLWLVAAVSLVGAGYGLMANNAWWPMLAVVASSISLVVILPWWRAVPAGAKFGALFDLAVILALVLPWGDAVIGYLG